MVSTISHLGLSFDRASETLTVGSGGQYATINAAIEAATKSHPQVFLTGGVTVTIRLLAGFVMDEQVFARRIDLSWIVITAADAEVTINPAGVAQYASQADDVRPAFAGLDGAKLPVIGCLFAYADNTTARDGVGLFGGSVARIAPGCGVRRARRGLTAFGGSEASCFIPGLTQGGAGSGAGSATGVDFSYARVKACHLSHGSRANLPRSQFQYCEGGEAVYVIWGSHGDFYQSQVHHSTGTAFYVRDGSTANCRETQVAYSNKGYHALHNARINARSKEGAGVNAWVGDSAKYCGEYGVHASYGGEVEAANLDVSECGERGVHASNNSRVNFLGGIAFDCGTQAVSAYDGSTISAYQAAVSGSAVGFYCDASTITCRESIAEDCADGGYVLVSGGFMDADLSSADRSGVYGYSCNAGTLNADSTSATDCQAGGYLSEESGSMQARNCLADDNYRGFLAYRGGRINARGSTALNNDIGFFSYEDGYMNANSGDATGAVTVGFRVDRGGYMNVYDSTGTRSQRANIVTGYGVLLDKAVDNDAPLVQRKLCEINLGFSGGTGGNTPLFTGAGNSPQGFWRVYFNGWERAFVMVRCAGDTYQSDERQRIVEVKLNPDGSFNSIVAISPELTLAHQGLGGYVSSGKIYLVASLPVDVSGGGTNGAKGFCYFEWKGAATSNADRVMRKTIGDTGSGHVLETFYNGASGVSEDGTTVFAIFADKRGGSARTFIEWNRAALWAAADPTTVKPVTIFQLVQPSAEGLSGVQMPAADGENVFVLRGPPGPFTRAILETYGRDGTLRASCYPGLIQEQYGRDGLLNHPTLGSCIQVEPEGIALKQGEIQILGCDGWVASPDIVSWRGKNYNVIKSGTVGVIPWDQLYWAETTKAATVGAWDAATTYNLNGSVTRKGKWIYAIQTQRGLAGEQPLDTGVANRGSTATIQAGENSVDLSWRVGKDLQFDPYSEVLASHLNGFTYSQMRGLKLYDAREGSDNAKYVRLMTDFSGTREIASFWARDSLSNGAGWNLYGDNDSGSPGAARLFTNDIERMDVALNGQIDTTADAAVDYAFRVTRGDTGDFIVGRRGSTDIIGLYGSSTNAHVRAFNGTNLCLSTVAGGAASTGIIRWQVLSTTGHFIPYSDSVYDLGDPTHRVRRVYAGAVIDGLRTITVTGAVTVGLTDTAIAIRKTPIETTTVNLPSAPEQGQPLWIADAKGNAGSYPITLVPGAGHTIGGSATHVIVRNRGFVYLEFDAAALDWVILAKPSAPTHPGYVAGREYWPVDAANVVASAASPGAGSMRMLPIVLPAPFTLSALKAHITTAAAAGNFQLAVYAADPVTKLQTGLPLAATGNISTAATGLVGVSLTGGNVNLPEGMLWVAINCDNNTAIFKSLSQSVSHGGYLVGSAIAGNVSGGMTTAQLYWTYAQPFGTWPDMTGITPTEATLNGGTAIPVLVHA